MKVGFIVSAIILLLLFGYSGVLLFMLSNSQMNQKNLEEMVSLQSKIDEREYEIKKLEESLNNAHDKMGISKNDENMIVKLKKIITTKDNEINELSKAVESNKSNLKNPHLLAIRPGVIVLGMHRSGTSIIGGLLTKMGLNAGDPSALLGGAEDNKKGFFERSDVILQNDWLLRKQNLHYSAGTNRYDAIQGLKALFADNGEKFFGFVTAEEGRKALRFYNNPKNYPWMMKDPRLCITFRTWLPQLNFIPAILFTYRHPRKS